MATVTLMGRDFAIAPYSLGEVLDAAPYVDRINRVADLGNERGSTLLSMAVAIDMVFVLSIGIHKIDKSTTADSMREQMTMRDLADIQSSFLLILAEAGVTNDRGSLGQLSEPMSAGAPTDLALQIRRLVTMLVAAGIEGGSRCRILREWTLPDVYDLQAHWREFGPPTHMAVAAFASAWGCKLTSDPAPSDIDSDAEMDAMLASIPMRSSPTLLPTDPVDLGNMTPAAREAHMRAVFGLPPA